jgi:uncharacterized protein YdhG (YjbR/CyaY superfamily)
MEAAKFRTVEEYFAAAPGHTLHLLKELQAVIKEAAPEAEETISYNMPAFKWNGALVYYAAYQKHIGFYPASDAVAFFAGELTKYKTSKGAIRFPLDKPIPKTLVKKIVKYRLTQNAEKAKKRPKR